MKTSFIHLRVHSQYSIRDGMVRIKPLIGSAVEEQMPAVALTDRCNLFGLVKFFRACWAAGIKPLVGVDLELEAEPGHRPCRFSLLCQDHIGYLNLTELVSKAYLEGQNKGVPFVKKQWVAEHSAGLIALSGGTAGEIGQALLAEDKTRIDAALNFWQRHFPDRLYLELQRTERPDESKYISLALEVSAQHQLPVVATNEVCFLNETDFEAHEARVCINQGNVLSDPRREKNYTEQQYFKTSEQMQELFSDIPEAITNTQVIAKRCSLELELNRVCLPNFPVPEGMSTGDFLAQEARTGLDKRLQVIFKGDADKIQKERKVYDERLAFEIDVINQMGFPGYFLIVSDFIQWAKENGIAVGPGRGSGAGSLVAYVLSITDLDPLEFDLLFERFLNPERVSMPDFDIDFCMDGRDRVIEYVANRYGRDCVSQIITFGSMAAKAVVRDVGRVLGHPYGFVDKLAKLIPFEIGMTLEKAMEQEVQMRDRYHSEDEVRGLIDLALSLEGLTRNAGKHAGGVVIAPTKLTDFAPLYCEEGGSNLVTQFDKDDVEAVGLVKFDFLGLRTLTIIDWALQTVNKTLASPVDIALIPTDDKATFDLLKDCATTAVFQLESRGMKDLIKRLQPDCFEEIIALVALFRPGPLQSGMVDDFIDRKHGRAKVEYLHPGLESILSPTYGVILYQEQVMQIAQVLAGYTLGDADLLRRAMGKKKPEEMAKQRAIFLKGAVENSIDEKIAIQIFDLMEKFAGYGFNKSHSAAYALIAYQTAWLKAHHPAAFMAAVQSSDMDNTEKVVTFVEEAEAMSLMMQPPSINASHYKFTVAGDKEILFGLGAIKGVGESAIDSILAERAKGTFESLFDFCKRVDTRRVNRRVLEALIRSGSMDCFGENRATLQLSLDSALKAADQIHRNQSFGQIDLFGAADSDLNNIDYKLCEPWDDATRLRGEKVTLGFYISGHPIQQFQNELDGLASCSLSQIGSKVSQSVVLAGLIVGVRTLFTKRGDKMAIVSLEDQTAKIEMAVFSDLYYQHLDNLINDKIIVVEGEVSRDDYSGGFRVTSRSILTLNEAVCRYAKRLVIQSTGPDAAFNARLKEILSPAATGNCPVYIQLTTNEYKTEMRLGDAWLVELNTDLVNQLQSWLGSEQVSVDYG